MSSKQIQQDRDLEDYLRAVENVAWLSEPNPKWACGEPVTKSDIAHLLKLNQRIVTELEPKVARQFPSFDYPKSLKEPQ